MIQKSFDSTFLMFFCRVVIVLDMILKILRWHYVDYYLQNFSQRVIYVLWHKKIFIIDVSAPTVYLNAIISLRGRCTGG